MANKFTFYEGKHVIEFRNKYSLNREQFAKEVGYSVDYICSLECNQQTVTKKFMGKLLDWDRKKKEESEK